MIKYGYLYKDYWIKILKEILLRKGIKENYEIDKIYSGDSWEPDKIILKNGLELYNEINGYSWCATENNKSIRDLLDNPEKYDIKKITLEKEKKRLRIIITCFEKIQNKQFN